MTVRQAATYSFGTWKTHLLYMALFCHTDLQSKALRQRRIYRGSGLGRLYPPLHQYTLMLFDGARPLHCTTVGKTVFSSSLFSSGSTPALC